MLDVERQRPVADVVEVVLDAPLERRVAAQAVHLRPAGDARPSRGGAACSAGSTRGTARRRPAARARADQAHLPEQHVPELRQLVERQPAQRCARRACAADRRAWSSPGLVRRLGVDAHGAELEHAEAPAVQADALLRVERRAPASRAAPRSRSRAAPARAATSPIAENAQVERALHHRRSIPGPGSRSRAPPAGRRSPRRWRSA